MLEVDPGRDALLSMAEELFPDESLWRQLRTEDARQTYAERRADEELHPELRRALAEHTSFHDLKRVPTRLHAPPDQIARSLFRVLGARSDGYEGESLETQVLFDVAAGLTPAELIDALKRLRGDRLALLGAARLWFHERFAEKLPPDVVSEWPAVLARVVVEDGAHRNKPQVIFGLRRWASSSGAMDFLHRLARGEISEQTGRYESPARAVAFFTLAMLKDSTLNDQLKRYQPQEDQNRLLLDVTRALEGEPDRLVAAVFQSDSEYVAMGATEAVRRYGGTAGMDVLVQYGLHQHDWYWHELSVRAFAEVVKADWAAPAPGKDWPSQQAVTKAIEDWWKGHGEDFKRRHPLKASAPLDP